MGTEGMPRGTTTPGLPCREIALAAEKVGGDAARLHAPLSELESGELQLPPGAGTGCLCGSVALEFACEVILVGDCNLTVTVLLKGCLAAAEGPVVSCTCQKRAAEGASLAASHWTGPSGSSR